MNMYTDVESLKKALEVNGFTSVKFPGGGGNMRQHSSIGLLWNVVRIKNNRSVIALLVLPFRHISPNERITHFSEIETLGETPKDTVRREIFEESGILIGTDMFQECCKIEIPVGDTRLQKYSFSAKTSFGHYEYVEVTKNEVELGCGSPIVVELKTLIDFLIPMTDNTSTYNKVSLRRALEKKILFSQFTNAVSKWYGQLLRKLPVEETIINKFKFLTL